MEFISKLHRLLNCLNVARSASLRYRKDRLRLLKRLMHSPAKLFVHLAPCQLLKLYTYLTRYLWKYIFPKNFGNMIFLFNNARFENKFHHICLKISLTNLFFKVNVRIILERSATLSRNNIYHLISNKICNNKRPIS